MDNTNVGVVVSERLARYGFGAGHPFGQDRHAAFVREFESRDLQRRVQMIDVRNASYDELLSFHTAEYVDLVRKHSMSEQRNHEKKDTPAFRGVYEAAVTV